MSTIPLKHRTFADWFLSTAARCGFRFLRQYHQPEYALLFGLIALAMCQSAQAQDPPDDQSNVQRVVEDDRTFEGVKIVSNKMTVDLVERFSKDLEFNERLVKVDGHDPEVISVVALDPTRLRIRGLTQGVTTMIVTGASKQKYQIEVFVGGDARLLQTILKRRFKDSAIECVAMKGNTVLLTGYVTDNQMIAQIMEVARVYHDDVINQMRVGGPQEVQLKVRVIEVQRTKLRALGVDMVAMMESLAISSTPSSVAPLTAFSNAIGATPSVTLTPSTGNAPNIAGLISGNHFAFNLFIQALRQEGLLKVMSEPILTARSGEAARLSDGGQFPIPVPGGLGIVTLEFQEFGVILETLPIVINPTTVKVQVTAEVSDKDYGSSVTLGGTTVPGLSKRRIQSTVEMKFGDTMVLGGMISTRDTGTTLKNPFLGELPLVGALFRRMQYQESETELMILITPEFGASLSPDQVPPGGPGLSTTAPTDDELFNKGLLEVPRTSAVPGCPPNPPNLYQANGPMLNTPIPSGPLINPNQKSAPIFSPLIGPPGADSIGIPPAPTSDPSVSRRFSNGSKSRDAVAKANIRDKSTKAIQPARFTDSSKSGRTTKDQSSARMDDE